MRERLEAALMHPHCEPQIVGPGAMRVAVSTRRIFHPAGNKTSMGYMQWLFVVQQSANRRVSGLKLTHTQREQRHPETIVVPKREGVREGAGGNNRGFKSKATTLLC